ncbi:MAG: class I SAM-dependent methyltransferase [Pseudomonadota bacterium]
MTSSARLRELRTIWRLVRGQGRRSSDHGERMESFYAEQAEDYDAFRKRLLTGRESLLERLEFRGGERVADLGCGTGSNFEAVPESQRAALGHWYLVDLSSSLLNLAQQRIDRLGHDNASVHRADATQWLPDEGVLDVVLLSYSLTMMPDWLALLEHAERLLRPGGRVAVVDFYVSRKHSDPGLAQHPWMTRSLWPLWFGWDDVFLCADHLPTLRRRFETLWLAEQRASVPWLPWVTVPVYQFIGASRNAA